MNIARLGSGLLLALFLTYPSIGHSYYSTLDTGEILKEGNYRVTGGAQAITSEDTGVNVTGRFDHWLNEEMEIQGLAGFGVVDFQAGAFLKWVPIPDYEKQPAVGLKAGVLYGSVEGESELTFRIHPMISKKFETEIGKVSPFAALPLGMRFKDSKVSVPTQIVGGGFYEHPDLENVRFAVELGFDLNKAFNYITLGVQLAIDDEEGIQIR